MGLKKAGCESSSCVHYGFISHWYHRICSIRLDAVVNGCPGSRKESMERQRDQRQKTRRYRHHSTRSRNQAGKVCSRTKRRTSTGKLWATCCHDSGPTAIDHSDPISAGFPDCSEDILRSVEADWILGEGDPDIILSMPAIGSLARIMYQLLHGDDTWNTATLRRLRLIVAKHRRW